MRDPSPIARPTTPFWRRSIVPVLILLALLFALFIFREQLRPPLAAAVLWLTQWADIASVLGFALAFLGFAVTIFVSLQSRLAAHQARDAASAALGALHHFDAIIEITNALKLLDGILVAQARSGWSGLSVSFLSLRQNLVVARDPTLKLGPNHRLAIGDVALQLNDIDRAITKWEMSKKGNRLPKAATHLEVLKSQADKLRGIQLQLRAVGETT